MIWDGADIMIMEINKQMYSECNALENHPETITSSLVGGKIVLLKLVSTAKKKLVPGAQCIAYGTLINALWEGSPKGRG